MRKVAGGYADGFTGVNSIQMRIGGSRVEIVRGRSPAMHIVQINHPCAIVRPEHNTGVGDVVGGVQGIERRTGATHEPIDIRAFKTIQHASSIGIRIRPVRAGLVFNSVRDAVAIKVCGLNIVGGVVLRVGAVKVFRAVVHPALVGVEGC